MIRFILILFFSFYGSDGFNQTIRDSASVKNEDAKKRVLFSLKNQNMLYSTQNEFDFINYLKQPENTDYSMKINYKETQEEKAIRKWNQYKQQPNIMPYYPAFRKENYYFTTY